jgi:3-methyladenine DNA glycosylase AlkD
MLGEKTRVTTLSIELLDALRAAGVDEDIARKAAATVLTETDKEHLATKVDLLALREDILNFKNEMIRWMVGIMLAQTGLIAALLFGFAKFIRP